MLRRILLGGTIAAGTLAVAAWSQPAPSSGVAATGRQGAAQADDHILGYSNRQRDETVAPGDDFFRYANGKFLGTLEIPGDRSSIGVGDLISERSERRMHALLESSAAAGAPAASGVPQALTLYKSYMDEAAIDALGGRPIEGELKALRTLADTASVLRFTAQPGSFRSSLFRFAIETNLRSPEKYALVLRQDGLGLPDRDYYLRADPAMRDAYRQHVVRMLRLAGWPSDAAARDANLVLQFETSLASAHVAAAEARDFGTNYRVEAVEELVRTAPGIDWRDYLGVAGIDGVDEVVLAEPAAAAALAKAWSSATLDEAKAWAAFHLIDAAAPYLASRFSGTHHDFHGKLLGGRTDRGPRWKQAMALEDELLGEAVSRLYMDRHFMPAVKSRVAEMVVHMKTAMHRRIAAADWMAPATKEIAYRKLANLRVKIAHPDRWRDYSKLHLASGDLFGSVIAARRFEWNRRAARFHSPVDHDEWEIPSHWVFAAFNGGEVMFAAGILEAPYFDLAADDAYNYGSIGVVIGHEVTHAFDDQGRYFNEKGVLSEWWQPADVDAFNARTRRLVAQFAAYEPLPGLHVDGNLTLGENIADLGGLLVAYDAYRSSLKGRPAPVIDGLSGDQRFFLGYARSFAEKKREAKLRSDLLRNPHSPESLRVNGAVRNVDAWYRAFGVGPHQELYLPPAERAHVW